MSLLGSKAIAQLILPPGGLLLVAAIGLIAYRKCWGRGVIAGALLILWLLSLRPVHDVLLTPLEVHYPPLSLQQTSLREDAVIVLLGGGIYEKAPEFNGADSLANAALMRTVYAASLARDSGLPIYTTGGVVLNENARPEGEIMADWLGTFHVPAEQIHIEAEAKNTWQNAGYIREQLQAQGIRRIVLVTSAYHMPRAVWAFQQQGLEIMPAPCAYKVRRKPYDLLSWLPDSDMLDESCDALHEYLGIVWYRLRYGD